jgi:hypothetical protein
VKAWNLTNVYVLPCLYIALCFKNVKLMTSHHVLVDVVNIASCVVIFVKRHIVNFMWY